MDAQIFLDNFGTIADAPGGVGRLRELVLDLAVRGQLTQQDPQDGSVDEQLSAIAGVVQPSTLVDPITDRAIPWVIPATWRWVRFKQIVDFAPGKTPSTKDSSYWEEPELGELWASIGDMPDSGTLFTTSRAISQKAVTSVMKRPPARVGALLMSFKLTIGKVCRVGRPTYFNEAIIEIDTPREVAKEFLFRTLPLLALGGSSKAAIKGNTLNKGSITNIPIPFPPLEEQERIVAKVDELMQLCDNLEARQQTRHHVTTRLRVSSLDALTNAETGDDLHTAWSRIHANWEALTDHTDSIEPLRHTILQFAVRGLLVERDPSPAATAGDLMEATKRRRGELSEARGMRRPKELSSLSELPKPFDLPAGWAWARFTELGELARGRSQHRPRNDPALYADGTIPLVQTGDVARADGEIDTWSALYNQRGVEQSRLWPAGTLCITIAANIADSALLRFDACFPDSVVGFVPFEPNP